MKLNYYNIRITMENLILLIFLSINRNKSYIFYLESDTCSTFFLQNCKGVLGDIGRLENVDFTEEIGDWVKGIIHQIYTKLYAESKIVARMEGQLWQR